MSNQVTCPNCQFAFVVVPGLGWDQVACPRCSHIVAVPEQGQIDLAGGSTGGTRQRWRSWGTLLICLAMPILCCCVTPIYFGEGLVGGRARDPFPFFSTVMTGVSALALLATGICLRVVAGWPIERIATVSKQVTVTAGLVTVLAVAGYIFGVLRCFQ
jgi:ribosomal protein S27E